MRIPQTLVLKAWIRGEDWWKLGRNTMEEGGCVMPGNSDFIPHEEIWF